MSPPSATRRRALCVAALLYLLGSAALGLRPYVPALYACGHGTDIGAYNMFRAKAELAETAALLGPGGERVAIDVAPYFWKHRFVSTTHPHVEPSTVARFVDWLAARPELRARLPAGADPAAWQVDYRMTYRINRGAEVSLGGRRPLVAP